MKAVAVLPLVLLDVNPTLQNSETPDVVVSGSYHCDGDPTLDIPVCLRVGL